MSTKGKLDKSGSEINSARSKLDGVLQILVEKIDDSPPHSDDEDSKTSPEINLKDVVSPSASPSKRSPSKPQRKRRRKDDSNGQDIGHYHHTYVMKLFDRSVDLAQFSEDTPLYPICRAWMRNQPHNRNLAPRTRSPSPEIDVLCSSQEEDLIGEGKLKDVFWLPQPLNLDVSRKDLRIPSPVQSSEEELDIYLDSKLMPTTEVLLANQMMRWKEIRQKWKEAAFANESRFKESLTLLKNMFENAMKS